MALTTYAELQSAVLDRMNRSDLTTTVVDWITIAEAEIVRWLRTDWVEKRDTISPTSAFEDLPADFNGLRNLQLNYQEYRYSLQQVSPDLIDLVSPSTTAGVPLYFCIHSTQFEFRPSPGSSYTFEIIYWFKPTVLSGSNPSNEILVNAPDLLFYRAVAEGFDHVFDDQKAAKYMRLYEKAKADIMRDSVKTTWSGNTPSMVPDSMRVFPHV